MKGLGRQGLERVTRTFRTLAPLRHHYCHTPSRRRVVEWIYSLQVLPSSSGAEGAAPGRSAGFRGGAFMGGPFTAGGSPSSSEYDGGHLAMTYTALAVLVVLKDDLRRIDRIALLEFVRSLQDGLAFTLTGLTLI